MPGLYESIWARSSHWAEGNYTRPGRTMVFGKLFVPFGIPKMIVVDADGIFVGMFRKYLQETLLIPVHEVAGDNQNSI